ncbi:MAG: DNA cytosine methyltransferase [Treponema sp.]|nr:DNA cytosine methyltransferase [Treponema sp.]
MALPSNLSGNSYKYVIGENQENRMNNHVQKQIQKVGQISNEGSQCGTVVNDEGLSPTLSAGTHGYANPHIFTQYRIRKLTPKECWRLMAFSDEDFDKAEKVVSNTQLYKQAGNSICVCVLMAIFSQMNIKGVKPWNERN